MNAFTSFYKRTAGWISSHPVLSMSMTIIVFAFTQALFSFCSNKTCPAFMDPVFDSWFPYEKGRPLYFSNGIATDTFVQMQFNRSESYKGSWEQGCHNSNAHYTWKKDTTAAGFFSLYASVGEFDPKRYDLRLGLTNLSFSDLSETEGLRLAAGLISNTMHQVINIGGQGYSSIQELVIDTINIKSTSVSHIYIGKNQCIVAYTSFPSGVLWIRR